jgi:hypothetical protein
MRMRVTGVPVLMMTVALFARGDLRDDLVFYLPFDEGGGATAADVSENALTGDLAGSAEWVTGKYGTALRFAASADLVALVDSDLFHIEGAITQAAWINLDRLPGAHSVIFGTRSGGGGRNIGFGYGLSPSNGIKVWTNGATGGFLDVNDTSTVIEPGVWYYVAYTHTDADSGLVNIYVDGVLSHSQESGNPVAPAAAPSEVTVGTWSGEAWPGIVDEPRLWARALSEDEIVESMNTDSAAFLGVAVEPAGKLATTWAAAKRRM